MASLCDLAFMAQGIGSKDKRFLRKSQKETSEIRQCQSLLILLFFGRKSLRPPMFQGKRVMLYVLTEGMWMSLRTLLNTIIQQHGFQYQVENSSGNINIKYILLQVPRHSTASTATNLGSKKDNITLEKVRKGHPLGSSSYFSSSLDQWVLLASLHSIPPTRYLGPLNYFFLSSAPSALVTKTYILL